MNQKRRIHCWLMLAILFGSSIAWTSLIATPGTVFAQNDLEFQDLGNFGDGGQGSDEKMTFMASFVVYKGTQKGEVSLTAQIAPKWHTFSTTQPPGGPKPSKITLKKRDQLKSIGRFKPDSKPHVVEKDPVFNIRVETFEDFVTWTAPIEFPEGVDPQKQEIVLLYSGQVCEVICNDYSNEPITATFSEFVEPKETPDSIPPNPNIKEIDFQPSQSHAVYSGHVVSKTHANKITAGDTLLLKITARGLDDFHVYGYSEKPSKDPTQSPTLISFTQDQDWMVHQPTESIQPVSEDIAGDLVWYYKEPVTWTFEIEIPDDVKSGTYPLKGLIGFQTCKDQCDQPDSLAFSVDVSVEGAENWSPIRFTDHDNYAEVKKSFDHDYVAPGETPRQPKSPIKVEGNTLPWEPFTEELLTKYAFVKNESGHYEAFDMEKHERQNQSEETSTFSWLIFFQTLGLGFLGGLILNIMPCVLPVIGLKIMSFVQQGGDNRGKAFALNATYSAGIVFVFLVLATLGVFAGVTWGKQFQSQEFNIVLSCVVFVFALSLIGIWEIPIPGFVGSGKASELTEKEGMTGAFMKGILTTILATPCTGPFIIPVLTWAFQQHPIVIYATFVAMGVGMASPFLIIGANPKLVSFLPKPGNWMVTFKQIMGFILLGTVIWIVRVIKFEMILPVFTLMFGLWLGCWWIGKLSLTADLKQKVIRWAVAVGLVAACGYIGFVPIYNEAKSKFELSYELKTGATKERPPGKYTLLVDFTAVW